MSKNVTIVQSYFNELDYKELEPI